MNYLTNIFPPIFSIQKESPIQTPIIKVVMENGPIKVKNVLWAIIVGGRRQCVILSKVIITRGLRQKIPILYLDMVETMILSKGRECSFRVNVNKNRRVEIINTPIRRYGS